MVEVGVVIHDPACSRNQTIVCSMDAIAGGVKARLGLTSRASVNPTCCTFVDSGKLSLYDE